MKPRILLALVFAILDFSIAVKSFADSFALSLNGRDAVIGQLVTILASDADTLPDLGRRYDLGYDEIVKVNPKVSRWIPGGGTRIIIPRQFVLPDVTREGIVLNLAELRLYYFPPFSGTDARVVYTYPISIGKMDWKSPLGVTKVKAKEIDPAWYPPQSIRAEHAQKGEILPDFIPGGASNNPLGHLALRLALPGYLIHGTDERREFGIGMRVTHGCIRMYPEDIEQLFSLVAVNTPVRFIDQPIKVGWKGAEMFLEVHLPLEEDREDFEDYSHRVDIDEVMSVIREASVDNMNFDMDQISDIVSRGNGIPIAIGKTDDNLPPSRESTSD